MLEKVITVEGQKVLIQQRTCTGGCGKIFWCSPHSTATTARRWCETVCKEGNIAADPVFADAVKKRAARNLEARRMTGLSERQKQVYEAVVGRLEAAAKRGQKLAISAVIADPATDVTMSEWQYTMTRVKSCKFTDLIERFETAAALTRTRGPRVGAEPKTRLAPPPPPEPEQEEEEEEQEEEPAQVEPEQESMEDEEVQEEEQVSVSAIRRVHEPVSVYTEVECYMRINAGPSMTEDKACANLGIDFGEYLIEKEKVLGAVDAAPLTMGYGHAAPPRPVPAETKVVKVTVPRAAAASVEMDHETTTLAKLIMLLKPMTKPQRDRIMGAASIMLCVD